ncbi:MAG: DUF4492 domain-containing protein [Bacteroidota bacterium]|nr:DUF4492 domain-containing protein [Bacteroidota bacterium]MDP4206640.1 DUF4492 domain-containing protein [Bacteroidota bacterium]
MKNFISRIWDLYFEGFREMTWGRTLWIIILIKCFVLLFVLKLFFFPDILKKNFTNDRQRSDYVLENLTQKTNKR